GFFLCDDRSGRRLDRRFDRRLELRLSLVGLRLNRRDMLRMRDRWRGLVAGAVEISHGVSGFRRRIAAELVADGSGETVLVATAPTTAPPAATPAAAFTAALLIATGGLLVAFLAVLLGFAFLFAFAGDRNGPLGRGGGAVLARLLAIALTATTTATA